MGPTSVSGFPSVGFISPSGLWHLNYKAEILQSFSVLLTHRLLSKQTVTVNNISFDFLTHNLVLRGEPKTEPTATG